MKNNLKTVAIALACSVATLAGYKLLGLEEKPVIFNEAGYSSSSDSVGKLVNFSNLPEGAPGDFTYAAGVSAPAVVHIKATSVRAVRQQRMPSIFDDFFGFDDEFFGQPKSREQQSSGSGVLISNDGYIATNNHVVEGAEKLEVVTYDKQSYEAEVVGVDPSTDIAVIKIKEKGMPFLTIGNSDNVKVGEWVLAVGNPFNLESTVTAGIVSAIGRDISILDRSYAERVQRTGVEGDTPIESFIQTDAAVNPGNSGGALVNLRGELIGINTAIASPNGAYAGYAFAVPSGIVKKVTTDIIKFGNVQRGYLGVNPVELNTKNAKEFDVKTTQGIYVYNAPEEGAAYNAGIKKGDVITEVDGQKVVAESKFREMIGRKRPGEKVSLKINRDGTIKNFDVALRNKEGGSSIIKKEESSAVFSKMGIRVKDMDDKEKSELGISNGVRVEKVFPAGTVARDTNIKEGFIINRVGDKKIDSKDDFEKAIQNAVKNNETGVLICGVYENLSRNYCYGITL
ncbi:trypsin-like peptidase domain-containing protein [Marinilongibacter aquaticus]|uniref:trypsin-like peptidase domain-containing protein n=1 Tax=Marinilongibacter aquaticus TaxID=2975157 RepID=UPI0021BD00AA|nr:trypsin-like peptidase domain-containing protein [Marinilongibacter aquaticus]UBM57602.1 trypsin-like peptidase domain-containing protein [Marinilongibacter aquaticus]